MRLPILNEDHAKIDEAQAIPMIRYAVDHGVNYIDSAWGYHRGMSEVIVEKALRDGYREKVKVATKLPCPEVHTAEDFDRLLNEQLGRLNNKISFTRPEQGRMGESTRPWGDEVGRTTTGGRAHRPSWIFFP
jgi:predicted aldo/keto reductase-like oxidoreductase